MFVVNFLNFFLRASAVSKSKAMLEDEGAPLKGQKALGRIPFAGLGNKTTRLM